jgi:predicted alpha/beta-fold hydrolase
MSKITSKRWFNARFIEHTKVAGEYQLAGIYPNRPLFAVGFSLGVNIDTVLKNFSNYKHLDPFLDCKDGAVIWTK